MANPRQRRKSRSGSSTKPSHAAKRKMQNRLQKHGAVVQNAPHILAEKWDRHKTVSQNFRALGLRSNLKVHAAGGGDDKEQMLQRNEAALAGKKGQEEERLPAQTARIIRDEHGNVVDIVDEIVPSLQEQLKHVKPGDIATLRQIRAQHKTAKGKQVTPWGAPLNDSDEEEEEDEPAVSQGEQHESDDEYRLPDHGKYGDLRHLAQSTGKALGKSTELSPAERQARDKALLFPPQMEAPPAEVAQLHQELESLSAQRAVERSRKFNTTRENEWLTSLIKKHGEDWDAAARDRLANPWQKTKGEIRRA